MVSVYLANGRRFLRREIRDKLKKFVRRAGGKSRAIGPMEVII